MKIWIYVDGRQQGPFTLEQLLDQPVDENTKVWYEGLPKWYPAGYLDELKPLFDGSLARRLAQEQANPSADAAVRGDSADAVRTEADDEEVIIAEDDCQPSAGYDDREARQENAAGGICAPAGYGMQSPADGSAGMTEEKCPPTYIGWSVFLAFCCCSPVSVAALAASVFVSVFHNRHQAARARKASEIAVWLVMISFALGMIPVVLMSAFFGE